METTHKFYIVDLVRNRPKSDLVKIPKYTVRMEIIVSTSGKDPAPESLLKRLEEEGRQALEAKEREITVYAFLVAKKVNELLGTGEPSPQKYQEALNIASTANEKIKNLLNSAKEDADNKIKQRLEKEKKDNENLTEARVRTVIVIGAAVIKLAAHATKAIASHGTDITAFVGIFNTLRALHAEFVQLAKKDVHLQNDLDKAFAKFISEKKKYDAKKLPFSTMEKSGIAAEKARKHYRDNVTKFRKSIDNLSISAGKIQAEMKAATSLKQGIKVGAACMQVKIEVRQMSETLKKREGYLAEIKYLLDKHGVDVDDRTFVDKVKAFNMETISQKIENLKDTVENVMSLVENIKDIAS